jgi:hypothetical protein
LKRLVRLFRFGKSFPLFPLRFYLTAMIRPAESTREDFTTTPTVMIIGKQRDKMMMSRSSPPWRSKVWGPKKP